MPRVRTPSRPLPHALARPLLCLTLGLLTSIALAWTLAATSDAAGPSPMTPLPPPPDAPRPTWVIFRGTAPGHTRFAMSHWDPAVRNPEPPILPPPRQPEMPAWLTLPRPGIAVLLVDAFGLPFRCLTSTIEFGDQTRISGLRTGAGATRLLLPVRPIATGLIGNSAFWGALWWTALLAIKSAQRTPRHRRGRCTRCGYDLRATPNGPCPECGQISATNAPPDPNA